MIGESLAYTTLPIESKLTLLTQRLNLFSMLNVKYLVSAYELPSTPGLILKDTVLSTRFHIPIYLYENAHVLPRIYLAPSVRFLPTKDEVQNFTIVTDPKLDFSKTTLIECPDCTDPGTASLRDTLTTDEYTDGHFKATISTTSSRWLVFSESNLPGWHFTLDNQPISSSTANYLFQALLVPKGRHIVEGEYETPFPLKK